MANKVKQVAYLLPIGMMCLAYYLDTLFDIGAALTLAFCAGYITDRLNSRGNTYEA